MDRLRQSLSQSQTLRQVQNLRQIQVARLLELPAQGLDQHIEEEVEKNPALEAEEVTDPGVEGLQIELPGRLLTAAKTPASAEENEPSDWNGYETDSYREPKIPLEEPEDFYGPFNFGNTQSLYESLIEQLAAFELQPWEREVVEFIIYNLTPEGLLAVPLEKLARQYAYQEGKEVPLSEWERLLQHVVHKLEPPGIGARNLLEALRLQIEVFDPQEEPLKPLLWKLVTEYGQALEKGHWERIRRRMGLEEATWKALVRRLASLNPRPGLAASDEVAPAVTPDFILHLRDDGTFQVEVLYYRPKRLRIRRQYLELLEKLARTKDPELRETYEELKKRVEAAKQFMEHLQQRERTLRLTVEEIVRQQKAFFLSGCDEKRLRPMILEDVARAVGLDISTVSRVAHSKYIQTPCGIYPLKFFFSEGIRTESGGEVANKAVWSHMKELIAQEDPERPYSDEALVKLLRERGIQVRRRTVAKYRQQLGIPTAAERRQLYKLR